MSETAASDEGPRTGRRRRHILIGVGIAVVLLAVAAVFSWMKVRESSAIWPLDAPPLVLPDPVMPADPAAAAALADLLEAGSGLGDGDEARDAVLDAEGPPAVPAAGWPVDDAAAQAALDRLLLAGGIGLEPVALDAELPNYLPTIHIADLRLVRALRRAVDNDLTGAWSDVTAAFEFGQRLQYAGPQLLVTMIGYAIEARSIATAERLLNDGWVEAADNLAAAIDAAETRPSPLIAALTGECIGADDLYARMGTASLEQLTAIGEGGPALPPPTEDGSPTADGTWLYDAEKTRAFARQRCHELLAAARMPAPKRVVPPMPELAPTSNLDVGRMLDNPIGRTLLAIAVPEMTRFIDRGDTRSYERRRIRLALARGAYNIRAGRAPTRVDDLVPDHLPAAPVDPLTDTPMALDPPPAPEEP